MYNRIEDIVHANKRNGGYFFSDSDMRSFKSRIHYQVYRGYFFVTSEPDYTRKANTRKFSVRLCTKKGEVDTVWDFRGFNTVKQCERAIDSLPEKFVEGYEHLASIFNHKWNRDKRTAKVKQAYQANATKLDKAIRYLIDNHEELHMSFISYFKD